MTSGSRENAQYRTRKSRSPTTGDNCHVWDERERTVQNTKQPLTNNWRQLSRLGRERTHSTEHERAALQQLETIVTSGTRENAQYRTRKSRSPTTGDNCHVWDERERTPQNTKEPLSNNWRQLSRLGRERTHSTEHEKAALQQLETTVTSGTRENAHHRTRKSRSPITGDNCHVWVERERTVQNTKEPLSNNWRQLSRLGRERTHSTEHERADLQQLETTVCLGRERTHSTEHERAALQQLETTVTSGTRETHSTEHERADLQQLETTVCLGRERTHSTDHERAALQQLETTVTSGTRENAQYRTRKSRSPTTGDSCHVWDERERTPQNTKEQLSNNWRQLSRLGRERRTVQNTKEPLSNNWRQLSRLGRERTHTTEHERAALQQLETTVTSGTRENAQYRTRKSRSPTTGDNCLFGTRENAQYRTRKSRSATTGDNCHVWDERDAQYRTRKSRSPTTGDNCHVWDERERTVQNTKEPLSNNWRQLSRLGRERTHTTDHERAALQQQETTVTSGTRENAQYRTRKSRSPTTGDNCHVWNERERTAQNTKEQLSNNWRQLSVWDERERIVQNTKEPLSNNWRQLSRLGRERTHTTEHERAALQQLETTVTSGTRENAQYRTRKSRSPTTGDNCHVWDERERTVQNTKEPLSKTGDNCHVWDERERTPQTI